MEEITEKLKHLREERHKYNILCNKCQNEIDKLELELHSVPNFIGQYIMYDIDEYTTIFGKVKDVKRLYSGIRLFLENELTVNVDSINFEIDVEEDVIYKNVNNIIIISKERYNTEISDACEFITQKTK